MKQYDKIRTQYLGCLGLLADCSVHIAGYESDELRDSIETAMMDAERMKLVRWRRILNRIEVVPYEGRF